MSQIAVRVKDIILNIEHPQAIKFGGYDAIGTVFYTLLQDTDPIGNNSGGIARPFFSFVKNYPLRNEIILILPAKNQNFLDNGKTNVSAYYLPNVNIWNHPHHNALPKIHELPNKSQNQDYQSTQNGLVRKVSSENSGVNLGNYFNERINVKALLPYEGDIIMEGRFGNSIRFGSTNINEDITNPNNWSDLGTNGDPITIIRNGQSQELDTKGWIPTIEDINNDDSSIYLTSNQRISIFNPASLNQKSYGANLEETQTSLQQLVNPPVENTIEPEFEENQELPTEIEEVYQSPPSLDVPGCIDPNATNYNEQATVDDGSCEYTVSNILVETHTDNLKLRPQSSAIIGNSGPTENIKEIENGINQIIGKFYKLVHLISSDKLKSKVHPNAIYEKYRAYYDIEKGDENDNFFVKDTLGFYIVDDGFDIYVEVKDSNMNFIYKSPGTFNNDVAGQIRIAESEIGGGYSAEDLSPPEGHELYTPPYNPNDPEISINNYPGVDSEIEGETIVYNLKQLMEKCIDNLIENGPFNPSNFRIKSAYRSKAITDLIGGTSENNEHFKGQALDFFIEGEDITIVWEWCQGNLENWHQLMLAYPERGPDAWIHISYISESENKKFITLLSEDKEIHAKYNGTIRENNNLYQDGIKL